MHRATAKDILRTIRRSLSRYCSILLIIAIGVAFFAGLSASGSDMRLTADKYYRESNTQDIQILSTLGFSDQDLEAIRQIDGVQQAQGSYFIDCMAVSADNFLTRVLSLPESTDENSDAYLNRLRLLEGRLPWYEDECVIDENIRTKFGFTVGSTLTLRSAVKGEDLSDSLHNTEFTVVGVVNSPLYTDMSRRGTTTVGDGSLDAYIYVSPENFTSDFYTQMAITYAPARAFACYDEGYLPSLAPLKAELETVAQQRAVPRLNEMRTYLEANITDGQSQIDEGRTQLQDAKDQLANAKAELEAARVDLEAGRSEYEQGKDTFQQEITSARDELSSGQESLAQGWAQYQSYLSQYQAGRAEFDANEAAIEEAEQQVSLLNASYALLHPQLSMMEQMDTSTPAGQAALQYAATSITPTMNQFTDANGNSLGFGDMMYDGAPYSTATPERVAAAHAALTAYRDDAVAQVDAGRNQLEAARPQLDATKAQLDAFKAQLDAAQAELDSGKTQLDESEAAGQQALNNAQAELENGQQQLSEGEAEYLRQEADARKQIADAEAELAQAQRKLSDAQHMLADLQPAEWYISDRTESCLGFAGFSNDSDRMDSLSTVFPVFFLAVASLVCLTTLARMVEEHRSEIGTFKALGYSNSAIRRKYMIYSLSATGLGCIVGLLAGFRIFPTVIINAYGMMYDLPNPQTPFHMPMAIACTVVSLACVAIVTYVVCRSVLKETPASIMRPKAPPAGKRIPLEYIRPLWRRMSFSHKVTARNIFRYKKRVLMTIFGIAGSSALVLTGFGLQDALSEMVENQFHNVFHYDLLAGYSSDLPADRDELAAFLDEHQMVVDWQSQSREILHTTAPGKSHEVNLVVTNDMEHLSDYISLQNRTSGDPIEVGNDGAVVTEKLASMLHLSPGSTLSLRDSNQHVYEVKISAVAENYTQHFLYLSESYYQQVFGKAPVYNSVILHASDPTDTQQLQEELLANTAVQMVTSSNDMLAQATYLTDNLSYVVAVLIISAGLLAFVVLYNLSNVNITERTREIATLKVLGFYDGEVSAYIYRESIILTLLGTAAGLGLGAVFLRFVVTTAEADTMMFARHIALTSFLFSALLTFLFSFLVNFAMHFRLKRINMVESMKSVD